MPVENGVIVELDQVEKTVKEIEQLTKTQVMVGIPAASAARSGPLNNAALGYIHEHGSPARNIPARPWLFPAVNAMQDEAAGMLQQAASFMLAGEPGKADAVFNALGLKAQAAAKQKLVDGPFVPLAPATIRARRRAGIQGAKPLIATAQMLGAVNYVVRKK